eukprot:1119744-Alexandrium_andersonii.AAC.1
MQHAWADPGPDGTRASSAWHAECGVVARSLHPRAPSQPDSPAGTFRQRAIAVGNLWKEAGGRDSG